MSTLRKKDGISGFLKIDESKYDAFGAGHLVHPSVQLSDMREQQN